VCVYTLFFEVAFVLIVTVFLRLDSSFVPPLVYAVLGSSRDLAVGTVAVASLLTGAMLSKEVDAEKDPKLYLHLAFTATFFAGVLEASLGIFRFFFTLFLLNYFCPFNMVLLMIKV